MHKLGFLFLLAAFATGCQNHASTTGEVSGISGVPAVLATDLQPVPSAPESSDDWKLPFSAGNLNPAQAKLELEKVYADFVKRDEGCRLNFKRVEYNGRIARVWWWNGKIIAAEWSDEELGANGTRTVFLDEKGVVRAEMDDIHGSNWYQNYWYYNNLDGRIFSYVVAGDISYDEEGIGHNPNEGKPLSKILGETEEAPGINAEVGQNFAAELYQIAMETTDNRTGIYNYKGLFGYQVEFIMHLDTDELNKITGKYTNGQHERRLSGTLDQETFILAEWDDDNKLIAEWHGRWVELDYIEGVILSKLGSKDETFSMKPTNGYKF